METNRQTDCPHQDFISDLPDDVLGRIMNHLWVGEAIRTTTLSKRWRNLWTRQLHNLNFDTIKYKAVAEVLNFIQTPSISTFVMWHDNDEHNVHLPWLVDALQRKQVRCLTLKCFTFEAKVPTCIFDGNIIRELHLENWWISNVGFVGGVNLTSLTLHKCNIGAADLNEFLQSCRNLESLTISECSNGQCLDTRVAPRLKHLKLKQSFFSTFTFDNPEIETFHFNPYFMTFKHIVMKLHPKLQLLHLEAPIRFLYEVVNVYNELPNFMKIAEYYYPPLFRLRRLEVEVDLGGIDDSIYFNNVLRKCVGLRELVVWVTPPKTEGPKASPNYWDNQEHFDCLEYKLTRVEVMGCRGSPLEEGFVLGLIGRKAKVLKTLIVSCHKEQMFVESWRRKLEEHKGSPELERIEFINAS